jgi:hypothetical protein
MKSWDNYANYVFRIWGRQEGVGETRLVTGTMNTDKLFTGQREIAGLGIYHYGARFPRSAPEAERRGYSPKLGRFISADLMAPNA